MKEMVAAMTRMIPRGSIWRNFSNGVAGTGLASFGVVNKKKMITAENPPMGRLM
jgi:hypothetical protein